MAEASEKTPVKSEEQGIGRAPAEWSPLGNLRREFDRMLEDFPWGWRRPLARSPFDVEPFWRGVSGPARRRYRGEGEGVRDHGRTAGHG